MQDIRTTTIITAFATAAIISSAGAAHASFTVQNDVAVSFAANDLDGIVGSGIGNSDFEVATNAAEGIEIGLKAIERFEGDLSSSNGTYFAPIGEDAPGLAEWNYVVVFDLGTSTVSDFDIQFDIDFDPAFGAQDFVSIDVDFQAGLLGQGGASQGGDSQNLGFSFWQNLFSAPTFDPNAVGEYDLVYTVFQKGTDNVLAQADITVVVPTPGTAGLLALAGLTATRRRRA